MMLVIGLLLIGGAVFIGLHHSHLDVGLNQNGITLANVTVDCGSPLHRAYPLPAGIQFTGRGPCTSDSALTKQLYGAGLAAAAGIGGLVLGITGLVRRPAEKTS
jgi:hypothetical protein